MSRATGRYQEKPGKHPGLAAVWSLEAGPAHRSLIAADGCFDIIVRVREGETVHAWINMPDTCAHVTHIEPHMRIFGVRLHPGYGGALIEHGAELVQNVEHSMAAETEPRLLESLAASLLGNDFQPPQAIRDFLDEATARHGNVRLSSGNSMARSRELQRACRRWLGLAPKTFLRIERAWSARAAIGRGQPLAEVAADLGYADQAHLTREVRALLGRSPGHFRTVGFLQDSPSVYR